MSNEENKPKIEPASWGPIPNIPPELMQSIMKEVGSVTEGVTSPIEAIFKARNQALPNNTPSPQPISPPKPNRAIAIDGRVLSIPNDVNEARMLLMMYLLATVWSKDKKIAKILSQFGFSFSDSNGDLIYPCEKKRKKK